MKAYIAEADDGFYLAPGPGSGHYEVEATEEQVSRWEKATADYQAAQDEMWRLYEPAKKATSQRFREQYNRVHGVTEEEG